jgi:hypothetical protein
VNDVTVVLRVAERDAELLRAAEGREVEVRVLDGHSGNVYAIEVHVQRVGSLPDPAELAERKPPRCPTCTSNAPNLHPAVQHEGEVNVCPDPWHGDPVTAKAREQVGAS